MEAAAVAREARCKRLAGGGELRMHGKGKGRWRGRGSDKKIRG